MLNNKEFEELRELDIEKAAFEIGAYSRGTGNSDAIFAAAYVLLRSTEDEMIDTKSIESFIQTADISNERALFLGHALNQSWDKIHELRNRFSADILRAVILFYEPAGAKWEADATPTGVISLAKELMEIMPGDKVADFGTGRGGFIRECFADEPNAKYYGNEINATAKEIASIRAELLGGEIVIEQGNILDMRKNDGQFDVAFSNYPFGQRAKEMLGGGLSIADVTDGNPELTRTASMDWVFNSAVYRTIGGPRRAVCIMTNGSTWNTLDKAARKWFLSNGSVEAVIALPDRLFEFTNIGTTMIVLSHGNSEVMMVDARDMCDRGRRLNVITESQAKEIASLCKKESKYSKKLSYEKLAENDFVLNPVRYMGEEVAIKNGVPFESVIKNITRGAQLSAAELDGLVSETPTDVQYLMLANIKDGIIDNNLPYLKTLDKKHEKYCVKNNALILSKNGAPFKIAVAEVEEGQKILANGNLYVIELDEDKVDPYYVKAFLESDKGVAALQSIVVGATIPNIGVEQLKKISVPSVPMNVQKEIALKYLAMVDEVKLLRRKMDKALSKLKHMFDAEET